MEEAVAISVNGLMLEGLLSFPPLPTQVGVVICHPHPLRGGDMRNNVVSAVAGALQYAGIATLRFNFRGVGNSGGRHDDGVGEQEDVRSAVTYLASQPSLSKIAVVGYSFGSIVGMRAGAEDPRVTKLVGIALPIATRDASFLRSTTKAKLLVCGNRDQFCPETNLRELCATLSGPTTVAFVNGADHFFWGVEEAAAKHVVDFLVG